MTAPATSSRPCVLVFAGLDPSGGAGIVADVQAVAAQGAHALIVATALTVQDNDRVYGVQPVEPELLLRQAQALIDKMHIGAVKIGITGSAANALAIAQVIAGLRRRQPDLPVVLDPVLASGHGDLLSRDDAAQALSPLLPLTTVLTPNGPEAQALAGAGPHTTSPASQAQALVGAGPHATSPDAQAQAARTPDVPPPNVPAGHGLHDARLDAPFAEQAQILRARGCRHVLITGGHGDGDEVVNRWFGPGAGPAFADAASPGQRVWRWMRLDGAFHGSGCTLASAIAGQLALGLPTAAALEQAQHYVYAALRDAYTVAPGQRIPLR
jgi:hydroxymethylpyrimidine/phosphomethylpyrimidine kinase